MRRRPGLSRATVRCLVLSAALAALAAAVSLSFPGPATLRTGMSRPVADLVLVLGFALGEQLLLNVEFRRQAHSLTMAGIPLVAGVLLAPVGDVVMARVVGAGLALVLQRIRWDKIVYNCSAWAFEAAVDTVVVHAVLGTIDHPALFDMGVIVLVTAAVDQLMSALVLFVIRLHGGAMSRGEVGEVLAQSLVLSAVASTWTLGLMLLVEDGVLGVVVAVVFVSMATLLYRAYILTTRRHQRLELIHDFVSESVGMESLTDLAQQMLVRIRVLLRAERAELLVLPGAVDTDGGEASSVRVVADESDRCTVERTTDTPDWVAVRSVEAGEPMLAVRSTKDAAVRRWMDERGVRDAIVVPLPSTSSFVGTLTVSNRLGEIASFDRDDLTLLETLTGHLAVAGESAHLVERLAYEASHDALTGLANRSSLGQHIGELDGADTDSFVLLLDLDGFKEINDSLGHSAGDEFLKVIAARLRDALPEGSTVARLGGDEFAALVGARPDEDRGCREFGHRLAEALSEPIRIDESLVVPDVSIGIALVEPGVRRADLLRRADTAMYRAKATDTTVAVYEDAMDEGRLANLALLSDLRVTLKEHPEQITVYFQPKIDLATRQVSGAEALVRWNHPTRGVVTPDSFIVLAETTGLIDQFTPLVLQAALAECRRWVDAGHELSVAINLSARNIGDETLPNRVSEALLRAGLSAQHLVLEITESSIIDDPVTTLRVLQRLADRGIAVSLDDFGTGYSSLSYLQRLPVQEVKIDRSFVAGLATDSRASRALISSIASLGDNLGLRVVAEGAETGEAVEELALLGCEVVQGYHIARPMPGEDFLRWLGTSAYAAAGREGTAVA